MNRKYRGSNRDGDAGDESGGWGDGVDEVQSWSPSKDKGKAKRQISAGGGADAIGDNARIEGKNRGREDGRGGAGLRSGPEGGGGEKKRANTGCSSADRLTCAMQCGEEEDREFVKSPCCFAVAQ